MTFSILLPLLTLHLAACTDEHDDDYTATLDDDDGEDAEDGRSGAYADIELRYETTGGEETVWSFRIEDGDANTGSRYSDAVTVTPDHDDDGDLFYASHRGCPDNTSSNAPTDRPADLVLGKGTDWDWYEGWLEFELALEDCRSNSNEFPEYECVAGQGAEGSYFELEMNEAGQFWSGTFSAYAYCKDDEGEGNHVGYAEVVATFQAREEEP